MKTLLQELKKLIDQLLGKRNLFVYKSTAANQLYLLFCLSGYIFFSDKIHRLVKYLWYACTFLSSLIAYAIGLSNIAIGRKGDVLLMLIGDNVICFCNMSFAFTSLVYYFRRNIEEMIATVDAILTSKSTEYYDKCAALNAKNVIIRYLLIPLNISHLVQTALTISHMMFWYDEEKAKNYLYYLAPIPGTERYGCLSFFLITNAFSAFFIFFFLLQVVFMNALFLFWCEINANEVSIISERFAIHATNLSRHLDRQHGRPSKAWNTAFDRILTQGVRSFQKTRELINYMSTFLEIMALIIVLPSFLYSVSQLYLISISSNIDGVIRLREILASINGLWCTTILYFMGQWLENSVSQISAAVYSLPWYGSVQVRKNVYIFMCQLGQFKGFKVIGVYPLILRNYSRYLHGVQSYVNILRRIAMK